MLLPICPLGALGGVRVASVQVRPLHHNITMGVEEFVSIRLPESHGLVVDSIQLPESHVIGVDSITEYR